MTRRWNNVDGSIAELNLRRSFGPVLESEILPHVFQHRGYDLNTGPVRELRISGAMVQVAMVCRTRSGIFEDPAAGNRSVTVSASGMIFGSETAPVSINRAFEEPSRR